MVTMEDELKVFSHWRECTGWWFHFFSILTPKIVEDSHFDEHIFQRGWFNHQLDAPLTLSTRLPSPPFFCSQAFAAVEQRELRAKVLPGNGWNPPHDEC